jgi:hypothetical protein
MHVAYMHHEYGSYKSMSCVHHTNIMHMSCHIMHKCIIHAYFICASHTCIMHVAYMHHEYVSYKSMSCVHHTNIMHTSCHIKCIIHAYFIRTSHTCIMHDACTHHVHTSRICVIRTSYVHHTRIILRYITSSAHGSNLGPEFAG